MGLYTLLWYVWHTVNADQDPAPSLFDSALNVCEVGRMPEHNAAESRSHFSAWAIVSAPLVLGFDLTDEAQVASVWPVLSNEEVAAVSDAYEADRAWPTGRLVKAWHAAQPPVAVATRSLSCARCGLRCACLARRMPCRPTTRPGSCALC